MKNTGQIDKNTWTKDMLDLLTEFMVQEIEKSREGSPMACEYVNLRFCREVCIFVNELIW
ncbi:MAG: hypothetical protein PUE13_03975 [Clostridiales bacterium]|nr:hypothetical protein [Clostridiales bacterium]